MRLRLARMFPQFNHDPFATAGFNPLVLPFRYNDPKQIGDPSEAAVFSFLLCDALDWGPGNYGRRHAYFVYQRSHAQMAPLVKKYDPYVIGQLVNEWTATHAVGGLLTRTPAGCTGQLQIYNAKRIEVFHKNYVKPHRYFDLLGDMAVDTLTYMKEPPNKLLANFLHMRLCQHESSILRLGMARALPQRSKQQLQLFQKILKTDPNFAEVRYWLTNVEHYLDGLGDNASGYQRQLGLSLQSRLNVPALRVFWPPSCRDPKLVGQFNAWVDHAARLEGSNSPLVLNIRLNHFSCRDNSNLIGRALTAAWQYPNNLPFLTDLCNAMKRRDGPLDAGLVCGIAVTAWSDRYLTPDDRRQPRNVLLWSLPLLGLNEDAAKLLDPLDTQLYSTQSYDACNILAQCGRFGDELTCFLSQQNVPHDLNGLTASMNSAVAATAAGNINALYTLQSAWGNVFDHYGFTKVLNDYQSALAGRPVDTNALRNVLLQHADDPGPSARLILAAETDVIVHHRHILSMLWDNACDFPNDRLYWTILDGYERQHPTFAGPSFYKSLQWLYPHDSWVQQAVAAWHARHDQPPGSDMQSLALAVQKALASYKPTAAPVFDIAKQPAACTTLFSVATPWVVTEVIHQKLDHGKVAAAHDLALRYQNLAAQVDEDGLDAWAARLVRLTQASPN